jgi:hypothetical protein
MSSTGLLDLPREILTLIIRYSPYVSKFMLFQTSQYAYTLKDCMNISTLNMTKKQHLDTLKITALQGGSIPVLQHLFDMGMAVDQKRYELHTNVQDIDTIFYIRDRVSHHPKESEVFPDHDGFLLHSAIMSENSILIARIIRSSMSVECVMYAIFCYIDQRVISMNNKGKTKDLNLKMLAPLLIYLYDHPKESEDHPTWRSKGLSDRPDANMLEKINIGSRRDILMVVKKYILNRNNDIEGIGFRLVKDLYLTGGKDGGKFTNFEFWYKITTNIFIACENVKNKYKILDYIFENEIIESYRFTRFISYTLTYANYEAFMYCVKTKIPIIVGDEDVDMKRLLKDKNIYFIISNYKTTSNEYLGIFNLDNPDIVPITKFLIDHGMKIKSDIFSIGKFHTISNIELIELLVKHGAEPYPYGCPILQRADMMDTMAENTGKPSIAPRLLELGFHFGEPQTGIVTDFRDLPNIWDQFGL